MWRVESDTVTNAVVTAVIIIVMQTQLKMQYYRGNGKTEAGNTVVTSK